MTALVDVGQLLIVYDSKSSVPAKCLQALVTSLLPTYSAPLVHNASNPTHNESCNLAANGLETTISRLSLAPRLTQSAPFRTSETIVDRFL